MKEISYEILKKLKEDFSKGTRVELIKMDDPYTTLKLEIKEQLPSLMT